MQVEDHSLRSTAPSKGQGKKRAREGAPSLYQESRHQGHDALSSNVPSLAVGPPTGLHVDGMLDAMPDGRALGVSTVVTPTAVAARGSGGDRGYHAGWAGYPPQGSGDAGQRGGNAGLPSWQNRWPDGTMDSFYAWHVPVRLTDHPFAVPGMPMPYALPAQGAPFAHARGMGPAVSGEPMVAAAAAAGSAGSAVMLPREAPPIQERTALPLQGIEGAIALTLSTLKGEPNQPAPLEVGHHQQQQHSGALGTQQRSGSGSSPASRPLMGSAPISRAEGSVHE